MAKGVVLHAADIPESTEYRGVYPACGVLRARGFHTIYPEHIVAGWQAAALYGLPYWADAAPVLMLSDSRTASGSDRTRRAAAHPLRVVVRPFPSGFDPLKDTETPDPVCPMMRVVSAPIALVQCLRSVLSGKHRWRVRPLSGLSERQVRAVQLIDAFAMCTTVTWREIEDAARGVVSRRDILRLRSLVSLGAESPRETELRLLVKELLPAGFRWCTQVPVEYCDLSANGVETVRVTFLDLACPELRIGVYYDGGHHGGGAQMERDFAQLQDLRDEQWIVVRVNNTLMDNVPKLLGQVRSAIMQGVAR